MATSNGAVDKTAEKTGTEKVSEKLAEKRRALGRGLESLLPGPRVVPASPTLPQSTRKDGAPASSSLSSSASGFSSGAEGGRAGAPVAPPDLEGAAGETLAELQAVVSGRTADGETIFLLALDEIDPNPYQTRREFGQELLDELADSIRVQGVLQP